MSEQTDGSVVTIDIAHQRETVEQAIRKLESAVRQHRGRLTQSLRVVTGRGKIGQAARDHLSRMRACGEIVQVHQTDDNPGVVMVTLKKLR